MPAAREKMNKANIEAEESQPVPREKPRSMRENAEKSQWKMRKAKESCDLGFLRGPAAPRRSNAERRLRMLTNVYVC